MVMFKAAFMREWRLLARQKADWLNPLMFFLIVLTLFPLGVGAKPNLLAKPSLKVSNKAVTPAVMPLLQRL